MSSDSQVAAITNGTAVGLQAGDDGMQTLKNLKTVVEAFTNDNTFKYVLTVLAEDNRLREQVNSQNEEIAKLKEDLKDSERAKKITYKEILDVNEQERQNYARALSDIDSRRATIREHEKTIGDQQRQIDDLNQQVQNLQTSYDGEKEKVESANKSISELQGTLKERDEHIDKMKEAGSEMKKKIGSLKDKYKDLEAAKSKIEEELKDKLTKVEEELGQKSSKLDELNGYLVQLNEEEEAKLLDKLSSFWNSTSLEIAKHLKDDIPMDKLQNLQAWKNLKFPPILSHKVPLPQSNTDVAKQMRVAVFLSVLARELNDTIFQPIYLSTTANDMQEILFDLAMKDSKKESFCRAMMLELNPEKQKKILEARKQIFIANTGSYLLDLLPPAQFEGIRKSLEDIVDRACEIWKLFQYSKSKYEQDFESLELDDDEDWERFPFTTDENVTQNQHVNGDSASGVLTIFPRICRIEGEEFKVLNTAMVLTKFQCINAELEQRKEPFKSRITRTFTDRQRTRGISISLSNANPNGFLDEAGQASGEQVGS